LDLEKEMSSTEIGHERVDKMMAGAKELWSKMTGRLSSLAGGAKERLFGIVGFVEKDIKQTGKDVKNVYQYGKETGREAIDIGKVGLEKGKDFAKKDYAQTVADTRRVADFAKKDFTQTVEDGKALKKYLHTKGTEGLKIGEKSLDVVTNFLEKDFTQTVEDGKNIWNKGVEAKNKLWNRVTAASKNLFGWANEKRMKMTGAAELRGEVAELKEQISRLEALVEAKNRLDTAEPEPDLTSFLVEEITGEEAQEALADEEEDDSTYESAFIPTNEELAKKERGQKAA